MRRSSSRLRGHGPSESLLGAPSRTVRGELPLSDFAQLRHAVHQLQREATEQLQLECESQKTFEHLSRQVTQLQQAFVTMSDAVLQEVDAVRAACMQRMDALQVQLEGHVRNFNEMHMDVQALRRTVLAWEGHEQAAQAEREAAAELARQALQSADNARKGCDEANARHSAEHVRLQQHWQRLQKAVDAGSSWRGQTERTLEEQGVQLAHCRRGLEDATDALHAVQGASERSNARVEALRTESEANRAAAQARALACEQSAQRRCREMETQLVALSQQVHRLEEGTQRPRHAPVALVNASDGALTAMRLTLDELAAEVEEARTQRSEDLDLLERAISTIQEQQGHANAALKHHAGSVAGVEQRIAEVEQTLTALRAETESAQQGLRNDVQRRLDGVARVLEAVAEAVNVPAAE